VAAVIVLRLREFRRERAAGTLPAALQEPAAVGERAEPGTPAQPAPPAPPASHRRTARRR
jgi:hypothetical protein